MTPSIMGLPAGSEIIILIIVALVIFGGSRLAGIGKGTGRAIREFKEETASLRSGKKDDKAEQASAEDSTPPAPQPTRRDDVVDAEVVDPPTEPRRDA